MGGDREGGRKTKRKTGKETKCAGFGREERARKREGGRERKKERES